MLTALASTSLQNSKQEQRTESALETYLQDGEICRRHRQRQRQQLSLRRRTREDEEKLDESIRRRERRRRAELGGVDSGEHLASRQMKLVEAFERITKPNSNLRRLLTALSIASLASLSASASLAIEFPANHQQAHNSQSQQHQQPQHQPMRAAPQQQAFISRVVHLAPAKWSESPAHRQESANGLPKPEPERAHALMAGGQHESRQQNQVASFAHLLQNAALEQQQSYWSTGDTSSDQQVSDSSAQSQYKAHYLQQPQLLPNQFVAYRQLSNIGIATAPTINRQIVAPSPYYELSMAPTSSALHQFEPNAAQTERGLEKPATGGVGSLVNAASRGLMVAESELDSQRSAGGRSVGGDQLLIGSAGHSSTPESIGANSLASQNANSKLAGQEEPEKGGSDSAQQENSQQAESGNSNNNGNNNLLVDKSIEPRHRRRIFNRILKKAEWNHLFVELSKVVLRYFLDLALKDVIGKQSGAGSESTTSRKKLDTQSELTDLLKDFVKTAISNI